jgi:hypothetical protein
MKKIFNIVFVFTFIFQSCRKDSSTNNKIIQTFDDSVKLAVNSAVDTLILGTEKYKFKAYLWRDFMPPAPDNGMPLRAMSILTNIDSNAIPVELSFVKQYVFFQDSIWATNYEPFIERFFKYQMIRISGNGPKWGPNVYADVISEIHDSIRGKDYYVRERNVLIERTD